MSPCRQWRAYASQLTGQRSAAGMICSSDGSSGSASGGPYSLTNSEQLLALDLQLLDRVAGAALVPLHHQERAEAVVGVEPAGEQMEVDRPVELGLGGAPLKNAGALLDEAVRVLLGTGGGQRQAQLLEVLDGGLRAPAPEHDRRMVVELVDHAPSLLHRATQEVAAVAHPAGGGKVLVHHDALLVAHVVEFLAFDHAVGAHHVHVGVLHQLHVELVARAGHGGLKLLRHVVGAAAEDAFAVQVAGPAALLLAQVAQPDAVAEPVELACLVRHRNGHVVQVLRAHVPRPPEPRILQVQPQVGTCETPGGRIVAVLGCMRLAGEVVGRQGAGTYARSP